MLNSLAIINFRNLKLLHLNSLKRINLFTGKNNTGKSNILDAISLYASNADANYIFQLLDDRGESYKQLNSNKNSIDINLKALSSLFTNRAIGFDRKNTMYVGPIENNLFGEDLINEKFISLRFVKYYDEIIKDPTIERNPESLQRKRTIIEDELDSSLIDLDYRIGIEIKASNSSYILPLERDRPYRLLSRSLGVADNYEFIHTRNIDKEINGKLWDNITLSEKESSVIEALKIIEPNVERIAFVEESRNERTAIIKLKDNREVLPLKSMGDGINRILTIILGLVNCDRGYLLIDEFENGLHYLVQEKLWDIIFKLAKSLNVQIFVTTHSKDCISSFEKILNIDSNRSEGKLIRLELKEGEVSQVEFEPNELKIADENNIETR